MAGPSASCSCSASSSSALAFWVEFRFGPPLWVHVVLWPVVTVPLAVALMRPTKAALVALQFRFRAREMGL